jgi:hypothetical protein
MRLSAGAWCTVLSTVERLVLAVFSTALACALAVHQLLMLTSAGGLAAFSLRASGRVLARTAGGAPRYLARGRRRARRVRRACARRRARRPLFVFPASGHAQLAGAPPHVEVAAVALAALLSPDAPGAPTLSTPDDVCSLLLRLRFTRR